jgi:hypothetical protein
MTLEQLAQIGESSAMIAVAVSLFGLWASFHDSQKRARAAEIRNWQKVVVYQVISARGPIGADDILSRYLEAEQLYDISQLKNELLRGEALQTILLELIAGQAIMVLPEEDSPPGQLLYTITRAIRQLKPGDIIGPMNETMAAKVREILYHVEQNDGKFTLLELKEYFRNNLQFDDAKLKASEDILLRLELAFRAVVRDQQGKIWRIRPFPVPPRGPRPTPPSPPAADRPTT